MPGQALQGEGLSEQWQQHSTAGPELPEAATSQGTACGHAASHPSNTRAVHGTQAPKGEAAREVRGQGNLWLLHCCRGWEPGEASEPREHSTSLAICHAVTSAPSPQETAAAYPQPSPLEAAFIRLTHSCCISVLHECALICTHSSLLFGGREQGMGACSCRDPLVTGGSSGSTPQSHPARVSTHLTRPRRRWAPPAPLP